MHQPKFCSGVEKKVSERRNFAMPLPSFEARNGWYIAHRHLDCSPHCLQRVLSWHQWSNLRAPHSTTCSTLRCWRSSPSTSKCSLGARVWWCDVELMGTNWRLFPRPTFHPLRSHQHTDQWSTTYHIIFLLVIFVFGPLSSSSLFSSQSSGKLSKIKFCS